MVTVYGSITLNSAANGGGIAIVDGAQVTLKHDAAVNRNQAASGGGVYVGSSGRFTAEDAFINGNIATADGGGVYSADQGYSYITRTQIDGNRAGGAGGGLHVAGGELLIHETTVSRNAAANGGGVSIAGGEFGAVNSTIGFNTATGNGGGVFQSGGVTRLVNVTVAADRSAGATSGTGFELSGGEAYLLNNIIYGDGLANDVQYNGGTLDGFNNIYGSFSSRNWTGNIATTYRNSFGDDVALRVNPGAGRTETIAILSTSDAAAYGVQTGYTRSSDGTSIDAMFFRTTKGWLEFAGSSADAPEIVVGADQRQVNDGDGVHYWAGAYSIAPSIQPPVPPPVDPELPWNILKDHSNHKGFTQTFEDARGCLVYVSRIDLRRVPDGEFTVRFKPAVHQTELSDALRLFEHNSSEWPAELETSELLPVRHELFQDHFNRSLEQMVHLPSKFAAPGHFANPVIGH